MVVNLILLKSSKSSLGSESVKAVTHSDFVPFAGPSPFSQLPTPKMNSMSKEGKADAAWEDEAQWGPPSRSSATAKAAQDPQASQNVIKPVATLSQNAVKLEDKDLGDGTGVEVIPSALPRSAGPPPTALAPLIWLSDGNALNFLWAGFDTRWTL